MGPRSHQAPHNPLDAVMKEADKLAALSLAQLQELALPYIRDASPTVTMNRIEDLCATPRPPSEFMENVHHHAKLLTFIHKKASAMTRSERGAHLTAQKFDVALTFVEQITINQYRGQASTQTWTPEQAMLVTWKFNEILQRAFNQIQDLEWKQFYANCLARICSSIPTPAMTRALHVYDSHSENQRRRLQYLQNMGALCAGHAQPKPQSPAESQKQVDPKVDAVAPAHLKHGEQSHSVKGPIDFTEEQRKQIQYLSTQFSVMKRRAETEPKPRAPAPPLVQTVPMVDTATQPQVGRYGSIFDDAAANQRRRFQYLASIGALCATYDKPKPHAPAQSTQPKVEVAAQPQVGRYGSIFDDAAANQHRRFQYLASIGALCATYDKPKPQDPAQSAGPKVEVAAQPQVGRYGSIFDDAAANQRRRFQYLASIGALCATYDKPKPQDPAQSAGPKVEVAAQPQVGRYGSIFDDAAANQRRRFQYLASIGALCATYDQRKPHASAQSAEPKVDAAQAEMKNQTHSQSEILSDSFTKEQHMKQMEFLATLLPNQSGLKPQAPAKSQDEAKPKVDPQVVSQYLELKLKGRESDIEELGTKITEEVERRKVQQEKDKMAQEARKAEVEKKRRELSEVKDKEDTTTMKLKADAALLKNSNKHMIETNEALVELNQFLKKKSDADAIALEKCKAKLEELKWEVGSLTDEADVVEGMFRRMRNKIEYLEAELENAKVQLEEENKKESEAAGFEFYEC